MEHFFNSGELRPRPAGEKRAKFVKTGKFASGVAVAPPI
jgi:hypothetical protein